MLPLSALPATAAPNPGADLPAGQPGSGAEGADFLALLAQQTGDAASLADAVEAMPGAAIMANAVADPAADLPATGKILPPGLPLLPQAGEMLPDDAALPAEPQPAPPPAVAMAVRLGQMPLARLVQQPRAAEPEAAAKPTPEAETRAAALTASEDLPVPAPDQALILPAPALLPLLPEAAAAEADAVLAAAAPRARPLPLPLPTAAPQGGQAQAAPHSAAAPTIDLASAAPPPAPLLAPAGDAAPRVAASLRVAIAAPADQREEPMLPAAADAVLPGAAPQPGALAAAPATLAPAAPVTRPHDFGALVDRLVAAREAMQPQAVSIAVRHADFGPVQLHFRQDDGALSVQLASPDPDFARAVSQAVPPVLAAQNADSAALNQGSARQDQPSGAPADGNGQQRGQQQAAQRDERGVRANPAPRHSAAQPGEQRGQQGIFA